MPRRAPSPKQNAQGKPLPYADKTVGRLDRQLRRRLFFGRVLLVMATVVSLSLAFAPWFQFYLAWVGLVPWLFLLSGLRTRRAAFLWSWLAGSLFFLMNLWWLVYVSSAGMPALVIFLGLFWGVLGWIVHGLGLLDPAGGALRRWMRRPMECRGVMIAQVLVLAMGWVALEFGYGNWPFGGMPFLFLGQTQSPVLAMCQIADVAGVAGVTFWVVAVNGTIAQIILHRGRLTRAMPAVATVAAIVLAMLGYGLFRLSQQTTYAGPTVMIVQPNFPQTNTGGKGATEEQMADYHLQKTQEALARTPAAQLVIWSETMMPPLNPEARDFLRGSLYGRFVDQTAERVIALARDHQVAILAGSVFWDQFHLQGNNYFPDIRHNSAYLIAADGQLSPERYDKIHLVPFGEYIPFRDTIPLLYRLFNWFSPYDFDYTIQPGREDALTVFHLPTAGDARFVTPICFEDLDASQIARMFRGKEGKRADFVVNLTNDGWFRGGEMADHLQAALFRSIENRAPTARSVNTGISGFVDSTGHVRGLIAAGTDGASVERLELDRRYTFYSRWGDLFAESCAALILLAAIGGIVQWKIDRRAVGQPARKDPEL